MSATLGARVTVGSEVGEKVIECLKVMDGLSGGGGYGGLQCRLEGIGRVSEYTAATEKRRLQ